MLDRVIKPTLIYGMETYNLHESNERKIRTTQNQLLRVLIQVKGDYDTAEAYMIAKDTKIARLRSQGIITDWATAAREQMFKWAGHVGRMELLEPRRWAALVLAFKDKRELEHQKFWKGTEDHLKGAHYWRFERPVENFFGTNWRTKAHPKEEWDKSLPELSLIHI